VWEKKRRDDNFHMWTRRRVSVYLGVSRAISIYRVLWTNGDEFVKRYNFKNSEIIFVTIDGFQSIPWDLQDNDMAAMHVL
jgi:hypothetical protein